MKRLIFLLFIWICSFQVVTGQKVYPKKIIEFGWDHPNITFLKKNIKKMEKTPFDGVAFSFDFGVYDLFDTKVYSVEKFQFDDAKKIKWKSFTDNFLIVRAESLNGPDWLNDDAWDNIIKNVKNISKVLVMSKAKGILFDAEYYYHTRPEMNSWIYDTLIYKGLSYEAVGKYVRKRGRQFIEALQYYKTDPTILSIWMLSLVTLQARSGPIEWTPMALYPFFIAGIMEGKNASTKIVDGNELGYSYQSEFQFFFSGEEIRNWGMDLMPDLLKPVYNETEGAQPVYFDLIYGNFPKYDKGLTLAQKHHWLASNLYNAFKASDEYVWFYNERINWWTKPDVNAALIIKNTKARLKAEFNKKGTVISSRSDRLDFTEAQNMGKNYFDYTYSKASKELSVSLNIDDTEAFYVFLNSRKIHEVLSPSRTLKLEISDFNGDGNLILVSKKKSGGYSFAFLN